MKATIATFLLFYYVSCNMADKHCVDAPSPVPNSKLNAKNAAPYLDSVTKLVIDTSTLEGKRKEIVRLFTIEYPLTGPTYDSLLDLNYDGYKDYVIGTYGCCGTGLKNGAEVYLYNPKHDCYIHNQQLSVLRNPTFYVSNHKITSFYLAYGGGGGKQLEWLNNRW